ncbi:unnamed protein product [Menidia menidia]|uniref:(Atlantic silverside) hypothetical protein n=1 Tax=Menidia menidia TaxID=238744 RepID=A0A8S4ABZ9_9TELE|nr:unnamed protein product [Menidia menidia]
MASLRQEHHYGLSCGKTNKNSPNITLYHVKLTDSAIRALEAYQNLKGALPKRGSSAMASHSGAEEAGTKDSLFSDGHYSGCRGCGNNSLHEIYTQTSHSPKSSQET